MATEAQINANRLNSQKATGPRTAEGKRAVSQNAVTHGLFARDAVIKCDSPAAYEVHREALLDELRPVGAIESMLAERIVSLSWRLQRVERMQNQATDCLIEENYLPLGRMVTKKWSNNLKIIEKLFMHERRIESSLNRTITKLKRLQTIRRIEREDAAEQLFAQAVAAELNNINFAEQSQSLNAIDNRGQACPERSRRDALGTRGRACPERSRRDVRDTSGGYGENFAKQSQFAPDNIDVSSFSKQHYDNTARPETAENKANRPAERGRSGRSRRVA